MRPTPLCGSTLSLPSPTAQQQRFWSSLQLSHESESESNSVMFDPSRPRRLYSPWNSPGQNTGVGSLSLLQGIFPTHGSNPGLPYCRQILYQLSHKGSLLQYWIPYPSPRDLPHPEIEPGSSALQVDSLPTELSGKPSHGNAQRRIDPNIPLKQKHSVLPKFKSSPLALIYIILQLYRDYVKMRESGVYKIGPSHPTSVSLAM